MIFTQPRHLLCYALIVFFIAAASAHSSTVHAAETIIIGQSVELSGQATGKENTQGARAYFRWINARGGVHGRQIELRTYDDRRDVAETRKNTEKLVREDGALALFGYRGTPTVKAILPLLVKESIPMIAPFTGAESVRTPLNPYLFHLRASYQDEAAKMVDTLKMLQIRKVAILYQDDGFGRDGLAGFERYLSEKSLTPVVKATYDRKTLNIDAAVKSMVAVQPQAVLMACTPSVCTNFIKQVRKAGLLPQFLMLSNVNSAEFFDSLGRDGRGIGVMQVMPYPRNIGTPVVKEFHQALKEMPDAPPVSYATLEGFVAAKLLVEGLRRAGANPTRAKLTAALEGMKEVDLGGVVVSYSPTDRRGSHFVELIVVGKDGAFWR